MDTKVHQGEAREDRFTGAVERQTSQLPSTVFLGLAIGSIIGSAVLKLLRKDEWAIFVGLWPAPFLIMGNYNKMVKQQGSDAASGNPAAYVA